jgi:hypothetical protein
VTEGKFTDLKLSMHVFNSIDYVLIVSENDGKCSIMSCDKTVHPGSCSWEIGITAGVISFLMIIATVCTVVVVLCCNSWR